MSIIQDIREKYAKVTVILIALALVGFILTDYFSGRGGGGLGNSSNTIGRVNGVAIKYDDFQKKVEVTENNMKAQGYPAEMANTQALEQTWNSEIETIIMTEQFDKLGLRVGKKELGDILYGPNAPQDLKSQFTDPQTGQYNPTLAKQNIDQMLKKGTADQKNGLNTYFNQLADQRMSDKFISLLANSSNAPRWMVEKQNADNSMISKISMVKEIYAAVSDTLAKVSDNEISDYISKHKKDFKQEESRSISYVSFTAAPNNSDSLATRNSLEDLKSNFQSATDMEQFLRSEGVTNYYNGYIRGNTIQIAVKDSIFKIPVGSVYGPYLDGNNFTLAKLEGVRQMPDTVRARHILIGTMDRDQQGQPYMKRDTATAAKLADSIRTAIANGANFDSLVVKFSDDGGSKDKGGVYEAVYSSQMVAPFNDFLFLNPPGSKGVVKTDFGYHYTEVLGHKGMGPGYKIAYLSKEIIASQQTDAEASRKAFEFAGDSPDAEAFNNNYEKNLKPQGLLKGLASDIKPTDSDIRGLGSSRMFVRNIYDAKLGEVLKPERIGDFYVVALVTEVFKEGTQSATKARAAVEPILRNKKKAAILKQRVGNITTLEAASAAFGNKPIETVDSLRMSGTTPALGYEPRVIGASFNPANKGKVVPEALEGINGVYVIRVDNTGTTPVTEGNVADQRNMKYLQTKQFVSNRQAPGHPAQILRNAATIKDSRSKRY